MRGKGQGQSTEHSLSSGTREMKLYTTLINCSIINVVDGVKTDPLRLLLNVGKHCVRRLVFVWCSSGFRLVFV